MADTSKKYLSLERLQEYNTLVKADYDGKISTAVSGLTSTSDVNTAISTHNNATNAHSDIRATLAGVKEDVDAFFKDATISTAAKDTLKEIQEYITSDAEAAAAMTASINNKADANHTHNYAGSSSVGGAATSANKVNQSLVVKLNDGTTEGTNLFTFNGSAAKSVNITPSAIGASASGHNHDDRYYTETEIDTKLSGKADTSHGNHVPAVQTANNATFLRNDNTWQKVTPANIGAAASSHSHIVANITDLTATATELNYMDGVTSNVQTQLDNKAASGHSHSDASTSAAGFMTAAMVTKLNGIDTGANKTVVDSSLSDTSTNPVQNKVVNDAISTLTSVVSTNTSSISANTTSISNLQTALEAFEEITSDEIQALFA